LRRYDLKTTDISDHDSDESMYIPVIFFTRVLCKSITN